MLIRSRHRNWLLSKRRTKTRLLRSELLRKLEILSSCPVPDWQEDGGRKMEAGRWRQEDGGRKMEVGRELRRRFLKPVYFDSERISPGSTVSRSFKGGSLFRVRW